MHYPMVTLEVLSSSNRERFEKSLIGQLFSNNSTPDSNSQIPKTKEPPPPVKAKPVFKPPESAIVRVAEAASSLEAAVSLKHIQTNVISQYSLTEITSKTLFRNN